jgi:hypothetical protein
MNKPNLIKYYNKFNKIWKNKCNNEKYIPNILPSIPGGRIIVIGDIHGDINILYECLIKAKLINKKHKWIGGETIVVQVGDQIDSCRYDGINTCNDPNYNNIKEDTADDINILYFMTELHNMAIIDGGAVYSLVGNHELMNVIGDTSYVSYNNIQASTNYVTKDDNNIEDGLTARKHIFSPGNKISNFLACTRKVALIIGRNLFVHAGIVPYMTKKYNINDLNIILSLFLLNELENPKIFHDIFMSSKYSPLWTRDFGIMDSNNKCDELLKPLEEIYKVGTIIVGHTPQLTTGITSRCDERIWLTDVAMSTAFNPIDKEYTKNGIKSIHRNAQVLEIFHNEDGSDTFTVL